MPNVFPVCSDLSSSELLLAPLRGVETVVHLAWEGTYIGPSTVQSTRGESRISHNIRLTQNLVEAAERSGVKRIVFVSAVGASRFASCAFLREKYEAELIVLNAKIPEKLVLRTAIIFGEGGPSDKFTNSIRQLLRAPILYPIPQHRTEIAPIHVKDMVEALGKLVDIEIRDRANIIELIGGEIIKVEDVFKVAAKRMRTNKKIAVRGFLASQLSRLLERESTKSGKLPSISEMLQSQIPPDEQLRQNNPIARQLPKPIHKISEAFPNAPTQLA
jgi:NADH dehydrogenase